ncbi:MAG: enolase C-terminal domain-like protein [Anaerolineae bacterium]
MRRILWLVLLAVAVLAAACEDPRDIERVVGKMHKALPHHYSSHAAVEFALWDLKGKALGVPVYQLLGGKVRDGVDIMGFVHHDTPAAMAQHAQDALAEQPYPVLKMKIGLDPAEDIGRYRAVAEAVGDRAVIQVDGNVGYTLGQAIPTLTTMERIGGWGRWSSRRAAARPGGVGAAAGDADHGRRGDLPGGRRHRDRAAQRGADRLDEDHQARGILTVQKIAAIFEAAGLSLSVAIYYDLIAVAAAHIAAATPCVTWPSPHTYLADTILTEPFEPAGLLLRVPSGPASVSNSTPTSSASTRWPPLNLPVDKSH